MADNPAQIPPEDAGATYQIGAVAELTHLSLRTLRYWEEEGLIRPSARTAGGFRMYSLADIERVRLVRSMKGADLSIEELRELVDVVEAVTNGKPADRPPAVARLGEIVRRIRERLEILRGRMAETEQAALALEALTTPAVPPCRPARARAPGTGRAAGSRSRPT